jgi:ribonuclease-3
MCVHDDPLKAVQANLDYTFHQPELLRLALTHPSYAHEHPEEGGEEHHNQRLEFLGDAVLDFLVAAWLYKEYPDFPEGLLTRLRATLVRTSTLARLAKELGIGAALRLGHGEAESGGRERLANLCDAMEAMAGALYLDAGLNVVWDRLEPWFVCEAEAILAAQSHVDAKSRLQEWAQAEHGITPTYCITAEEGPDHAKMFTAQVSLSDNKVGEGMGSSKRAAEQAAARQALARLIKR